MSKINEIQKLLLAAAEIGAVKQLFETLGFPVSATEDGLHVELDENSFLEVLAGIDRSEASKRARQHVYQRAGILAISVDFEEWIFIRLGLEERIRLQRYRLEKKALRENKNAVALQRLSGLRYGNLASFEDLFERKDISQRFYREFIKQKIRLSNAIKGIEDAENRRLYAQILLDRLIFLFFLQARLLLDGQDRYFTQKYNRFSKKKNEFYSVFLVQLFFEALCREERSTAVLEIVGQEIPYLNGGLFLKHELEEQYPRIQVENEAFAELFTFFEAWHWNVNERSDSDADSIDPYILGYIFENTLGENKSGGVYYTPPALSEFLTDETIEAHLLGMVDRLRTEGPYQKVEDFIDRAHPDQLILFFSELRRLKVADPACGSGQFLVQALHRLSLYHEKLAARAEQSAQLKAFMEKDYRLDERMQYAIRRFITANNLFGCDILPEATEITRLRLFLAMVEGIGAATKQLEPLPNIDFHIRSGNALTGFLHLPEDFFTALPAGKKGRPAQGVLDFGGAPEKMLRKENLIFLYTGEKSPEKALALRQEIKALDQELAGLLHQRLEQLLGEWKVKPKNKIDFIDLKKDAAASTELRAFRLNAADLLPLHWGLEFSGVLHPSKPNEPGFDLILTNPPWEIWKPNSQEFFEDLIKDFRSLDKNAARRAVAALFKKDPQIQTAWLRHCAGISSMAEFFRQSDHYPQRGSGDINLYKLFLERSFYLLREGGSLGMVIPSGLYSDLGSKDLRRLFFEKSRIHFLYGLENRRLLFENVDSRFKFILLSLSRSKKPAQSVPAAFMLHTEQELRSTHLARQNGKSGSRFLDLPLELIKRLSPDALSIMEFKSDLDIAIVEKMARFPRLGEELPDTWNVKLSAEFHMTNDAHLFVKREELEKKGAKYDQETMVWKKGQEQWWPLYEGRMVAAFDHRAASYVSGSQRSAVWNYLDFPKNTASQPHYWIVPQWPDQTGYKIYICDVTAATNKRTGLATLLARSALSGNSLAVIDTGLEQANLCLLAMLNSYVVDYYARLRIPGNHYNQAVLFDLSVPRFPTAMQAGAAVAVPAPLKGKHSDEELYRHYEAALIQRSARLVGTTAAFDALLGEVFGPGCTHKTHGCTDPEERQKLCNEIDAMVAHIYRLTKSELQHVLSTFPLVEEEIKAGVLEEFVKMGGGG